jgi:hypothetical protein
MNLHQLLPPRVPQNVNRQNRVHQRPHPSTFHTGGGFRRTSILTKSRQIRRRRRRDVNLRQALASSCPSMWRRRRRRRDVNLHQLLPPRVSQNVNRQNRVHQNQVEADAEEEEEGCELAPALPSSCFSKQNRVHQNQVETDAEEEEEGCEFAPALASSCFSKCKLTKSCSPKPRRGGCGGGGGRT